MVSSVQRAGFLWTPIIRDSLDRGNEVGDWGEKAHGRAHLISSINTKIFPGINKVLALTISLLFPGDKRLAMASNVSSDHETTAVENENSEKNGKFSLIQ